jgi:hypothetical protein
LNSFLQKISANATYAAGLINKIEAPNNNKDKKTKLKFKLYENE